MKILLLFLVILGATCFQAVLSADSGEFSPIVQTKAGQVRGQVKTILDQKVHFYEGIKFGNYNKPKIFFLNIFYFV